MNLQTILDKLIKDHGELQGGPFTWKAVQEGPLVLGIRGALEQAYELGYDEGTKDTKAALTPKKK